MSKKKNTAGDVLFLLLFAGLAIYLYSLAGAK